MKALIAEMPDEPLELARWLERHLVGDQLGRLVAQLKLAAAISVRSDRSDRWDSSDGSDMPDGLERSVRSNSGPLIVQILGDKLPIVLREGLTRITHRQFRHLLSQPDVLIDLQEQILVHGGPYWKTLAPFESPDLHTAIDRNRRRLQASLSLVGRDHCPVPPQPTPPSLTTPSPALASSSSFTTPSAETAPESQAPPLLPDGVAVRVDSARRTGQWSRPTGRGIPLQWALGWAAAAANSLVWGRPRYF